MIAVRNSPRCLNCQRLEMTQRLGEPRANDRGESRPCPFLGLAYVRRSKVVRSVGFTPLAVWDLSLSAEFASKFRT